MHALGFTHRDLYPRNLIVQAQGHSAQFFMLDAWRGGPRLGLRGPEYDLACFLLFAPLLLEPGQVAAFLDSYFADASAIHRQGAMQRVLHLRKLLRKQLIAKGRRRHPLPPVEWLPPEASPGPGSQH